MQKWVLFCIGKTPEDFLNNRKPRGKSLKNNLVHRAFQGTAVSKRVFEQKTKRQYTYADFFCLVLEICNRDHYKSNEKEISHHLSPVS